MWLIKIFVKIVLSRIPISNKIWCKFNLFKHGEMLDIIYAQSVFHCHFQHYRKISEKSTILELGPGDSLFSGIFSWHNDCRSFLIDSDEYAEKSIDKYVSQLDSSSVGFEKLVKLDTNDWLSEIGCAYLTDGLNSIKTLPNESVDFIFSQAVLEHIFKHEYESYAEEMFRILKNGGAASHRIDYKDHLSSSINNLRFSDEIWESKIFQNSGFYTNRIRASQTIKIFERVGFVVSILKTDKFDGIPLYRKKLDAQFQHIDHEDLIISGMNILCFKK